MFILNFLFFSLIHSFYLLRIVALKWIAKYDENHIFFSAAIFIIEIAIELFLTMYEWHFVSYLFFGRLWLMGQYFCIHHHLQIFRHCSCCPFATATRGLNHFKHLQSFIGGYYFHAKSNHINGQYELDLYMATDYDHPYANYITSIFIGTERIRISSYK